MPFLFRTPIVIRRKQPYIDWANALDDTGPQLTAELAETRDIYLGRHSISTPTLQQALDQMWDEIFEEELYSWSTDEQQWPKNRTRELFDAWFDAELCASIIDLVPDEPLTEDDIELEDLEVALNTCAVCGAEIPMGSGPMVPFQLLNRDRLEHREGRVLVLPVARDRFITGVVTPMDSTPAQEGGDIIFRACGRRCEKQIMKLVPRSLRKLEDDLARASS